MKCNAYTVTEISNNHWCGGEIFNCEGRVFIYNKELEIITRNSEPVKLKEYKDKIFFNGLWYRGGKECRECKNRICGLDDEFFVYNLGQ